MRGRPTDYTDKLADEICDVISCSNKGIKKLCEANENWPHPDTIFLWLKTHKYFSDQYVRAKQLQIEVFIDEILEISDDNTHDYISTSDGKKVIDHEHVQRARLRIDTRKWLASKLVPKVYGERTPENNDLEKDSFIEKAKQEVAKLKGNDHGRSTQT